jgi:hypothetical protein
MARISNDVPQARAEALMALPKICGADLSWSERGNHAGHLVATAALEDETGATIPGLTLQLEIKKPILVDRCLYELGVFILDAGVRRRAYQLNVCPPDKRSHNGPTVPLYGPHEHIGTTVLPVADPQAACGNFEGAFALYCARINLTFTGKLNSPL